MYVSASLSLSGRFVERLGTSSSPSSATWFVCGGLSFYGNMIGGWSRSFPSACLGPLVCAVQDNDIHSFCSSRIGACIYDLKLALEVHPGTRGEEHLPEGKLAVIVVGPMLGTNVLSTSLIAWKAWTVTWVLVYGVLVHRHDGCPPPHSQGIPSICGGTTQKG